MTTVKRPLLLIFAFAVLAPPSFSESIRGHLSATLEVPPSGPAPEGELALDEIVLIRAAGDYRFFDAVEIEVSVPAEVVEIPGAISLLMVTTGTQSERAGVAEIHGTSLISHPLTRAGRLFIQVPLHPDAQTSGSAAMLLIQDPVGPDDLPLAITLLAHMKGAPAAVAGARLPVSVRPVARRIGAARLRFPFEDGTEFQTESFRAPEFELRIDGEPVEVSGEYLLEPGIHRFSLTSDRYLDQEITAGIEQAVHTEVVIPLLPALAKVHYTAPRGSRIYVDGQALTGSSGDFTAVPGQHTIVVVVGDYTVTRRFSVVEGREYGLSISMDVVIEEAK